MRLTALLPALPAFALLGACATTPAPGPPPPRSPDSTRVPPSAPVVPSAGPFRVPQIMRMPGLEGVIEAEAAALVRRFGTPRLDTREGDMRKLQFTGEACVLDVFLYPLRQGGEPVATYVDARRVSDALDVDRAACVRSLTR